jgi:hypothetical protein
VEVDVEDFFVHCLHLDHFASSGSDSLPVLVCFLRAPLHTGSSIHQNTLPCKLSLQAATRAKRPLLAENFNLLLGVLQERLADEIPSRQNAMNRRLGEPEGKDPTPFR